METFIAELLHPVTFLPPRLVPKCLLCLACWCGLGAEAGEAERELRLATDFDAPRSTVAGDGFDDRVVAEACRRAGVAMIRVHLPAARSLEAANHGIEDGLYSRIDGFTSRYPNLVMVPEAVGEISYVAFSRDTKLAISGWQSLRPLAVAVVLGRATTEENTLGMPNVIHVREPMQLFQMLKAGRVEVAVYEHWQGVVLARRVGLDDVVVHLPALERRPLYLYLNSRHADLAPKLADALRAMKQDGTYARLRAQTTALVDESSTPQN